MDNESVFKYEDDFCKNIGKSFNDAETLTIPSILPERDQRRSTGKGKSKRRVKKSKSIGTTCSTPNVSLLRKYTGEAYSRVQAYLEDKKISKLFNFLIGHLLVEGPSDPIRYLENILKECILYKSGVIEPPLLFKTRHIRSMFQSLGPDNCDTISLDKYMIGMATLGVCACDSNPFQCAPGRVDSQTFEKEARRYLDKALDDMIGKERKDTP